MNVFRQNGGDTPDAAARHEKETLVNSLTRYNGNMSKAAKALGIHRSTLYAKLAVFGISGKTFRAKNAAKK
jgi:transcriptional regulator of acetoin/glycerol metabolism